MSWHFSLATNTYRYNFLMKLNFLHFTKYCDRCSVSVIHQRHHFYGLCGTWCYECITICLYTCLLMNICISKLQLLTALQYPLLHIHRPVHTCSNASLEFTTKGALPGHFQFSKWCQTAVQKSCANTHSYSSDHPVLAGRYNPFHGH